VNSTDLLSEVRRLWLGPSTNLLASSDEDVLAHADAVLESEILPRLIDLEEGYLVSEIRETPTSNRIRIPDRAYNGQVYTLFWRSGPDGPRQELEFVHRADLDNVGRSSGAPTTFHLQGNYIHLIGQPQGVLDIAFPFAPGKLVVEDEWRTITDIDDTNPDAPVVTLDQTVPSDWTTSSTFDIQSFRSGNEVKYWDLPVSAIVGNEITFASELSGTEYGRSSVEVGDKLLLAGKAAYPTVPSPLHSVLAQGTAARIATSQSDGEAYGLMKNEFLRNLEAAFSNLDRRYEGRNLVINHNSRFRRGEYFRGWRGRRLF